VNGPLTRSIKDARLGLAALEGHDPGDPWAFPPGRRIEELPEPIPVAMVSSIDGVELEPEVVSAIQQAARFLEDAGYRVEEVSPPDLREAGVMFWTLIMTEERAATAEEKGSSTRAIELYGDEAVKKVRAGNKAYAGEYDFDRYIRALARRSSILRSWRFFLKRYPLVLLPTSCMVPFPIDF